MDMTLDRIREVWSRLNGRSPGFTIIVGGTNGKGSTITMLESAFTSCGLLTGAYTSPHLVRYNERVRLGGVEASDQLLCDAFCQIEAVRHEIPLTYFEYGTLCALVVFNNAEVDVSLLEVGMGGRLDATNMIDGDISVITSIGIDHEQWLGSDREVIATEKAGIMRPFKPVICSDPKPPLNISASAGTTNALLLQSNSDFSISKNTNGFLWQSDYHDLEPEWKTVQVPAISLAGKHQTANLAGVIAVLGIASNFIDFDQHDALLGLSNSRLAARCEIVQHEPLMIVDVAHNADSAMELARFLEDNPVSGKTIAVFGVLKDKSVDVIVSPVRGYVDCWMLTSLGGERGQTSNQLVAKMSEFDQSLDCFCFDSPVSAYEQAKNYANPEDRIVIFGSFYTVGDIIGHIQSSM